MNRNFCMLLSLIFLLACQSSSEKNSFTHKLPKADSITLEKWVAFYDKLLVDNYATLQPTKLLEDLSASQTSDWIYNKEELCTLLSEFESSTLELKIERADYDTVYQENSTLISVTQEKDTVESILFAPDDHPLSAVELTQQEGYIRLINESSFVQALKAEQISPEITQYVEAREFFGKIGYSEMVEVLLNDTTVDHQDFYIKRIVVFEILYSYMASKHGC